MSPREALRQIGELADAEIARIDAETRAAGIGPSHHDIYRIRGIVRQALEASR